MIKFKDKLRKKKSLGKINKLGTNRKYKEEEILNHNKISKFYIRNFRYYIGYLDVESNLTLKNKKQ